MSGNETLVTITDIAASKLRGVMLGQNQEPLALRVALVRTHCMDGTGLTYRLALEDCPKADDQVSEHNGIKVCVDPASAKYLKGAELDFIETLAEAGFKINNPNIIAKCPCGQHDIFNI